MAGVSRMVCIRIHGLILHRGTNKKGSTDILLVVLTSSIVVQRESLEGALRAERLGRLEEKINTRSTKNDINLSSSTLLLLCFNRWLAWHGQAACYDRFWLTVCAHYVCCPCLFLIPQDEGANDQRYELHACVCVCVCVADLPGRLVGCIGWLGW